MKTFLQMLCGVLIGLVSGLSVSWQKHQKEVVEVVIERIVDENDDHAMKFVDMKKPYSVLCYRPPQKRWAVSGIAGDLNASTNATLPLD